MPNRDNSAISGGRPCHRAWQIKPGGGYAVCTRPAMHDGPCVDRVHNITSKEQPK
jgi:hypothetical protein